MAGAVLVVAPLAMLAACGSGPRPATATTTSSTTPPSTSTSSTTTTAAAAPFEWTTYGGSPARTSADTVEAVLDHAPAAAWTSPGLDGAVYGEALVFGGAVLVATENDTVYALSAADGSVRWSLHLASPVSSGQLPCGNITPAVGVTSTMVIDPATHTLFVSAAASQGGTVAHVLYAVDTNAHTVTWSRPLDQPGWSAPAQLQRAGLALDSGEVLVGFGGNYGDCGSYHGWVVAAPESGSGPLHTYEVPTRNEAGIWAPPGPAVDANGDVFVATGNGAAGAEDPFDHSESVEKLSPALAELGYFAPSDWAQDSQGDLDLGATSPVLLGGDQVFEVGKQATGFLLHASSLGGIDGAAASVALCNSRGATAFEGGRLFVVCSDAGTIDEVQVGPGDSLHRGWTWSSPSGGSGPATWARGTLWVVDRHGPTLYGIDPASGGNRWSIPLTIGGATSFASVSAGEGLVVVAGTDKVEAFR